MASTFDSWASRALERLAERAQCGRLDLTLPDGRRLTVEGAAPGPAAELQINRPRFLWSVLTGGDEGFADAYLRGDCDSPDLTAVLLWALANEAKLAERIKTHPLVRAMQRGAHLLRDNTRRGAKRNIHQHYDLGNAFYEKWLDPSMTYSSALFAAPTESLEAAQSNKYRAIAERAALAPDQNLLEVGCGWGGFATYAAGEIGCKVTALTISDSQYEFASQRIQAEGLGERVEVRRQDYRDVDGRFDRIVSIEMFEAVGERYWPLFFETLRDRLTDSGRAALQVITISDSVWEQYRRGADFIQRYVFPGGMLPAPSVLAGQVEAAGLKLGNLQAFGPDYAETLKRWRDRFEAAWPEIAPLGFDERFRRLWRYYLCYCEAGFLTGRIDVRQFSLAKA